MSQPERPEFWDEAIEIVATAPIAYLTTVYREQPSVRAVTPTYEGIVAYIASDPHSWMARSIRANPLVELMHHTRDFRHVRLRGRAAMTDDAETKERMWGAFGYDLADFFGERGQFEYGLMRIEPFRIEVSSLQRIATGKPPLIWRIR